MFNLTDVETETQRSDLLKIRRLSTTLLIIPFMRDCYSGIITVVVPMSGAMSTGRRHGVGDDGGGGAPTSIEVFRGAGLVLITFHLLEPVQYLPNRCD
jgi:hypothetical protein